MAYATAIWTRGVYYEGLMALYSVYPRDDYYKYAVDWSNYHEWGGRQGEAACPLYGGSSERFSLPSPISFPYFQSPKSSRHSKPASR
ncbi:glycoside hydrolase family 88 protein [Bilophila wadsworthia]|uniref:glycoside hydrolase family 88 protein n=1 Tax=Bilophila wadsworthia TaxID=35833 RepID=UPI003AB3E633